MLVLEDLMVHREEALNLEAVHIDALIGGLSLEQFGSLCRVLSFAVVDMSSEPEELLWAIDESKKCKKRTRIACEKVSLISTYHYHNVASSILGWIKLQIRYTELG